MMGDNVKKKNKAVEDEVFGHELFGEDSRFKLSAIDVENEADNKTDLLGDKELVDSAGFDVVEERESGIANIRNPMTGFSGKGKPSTKVTILKKDSIEEINPHDLKKIIKETQDIKQVVIEQMKLKEGSRVRLLFDLEKENAKSVNNITNNTTQREHQARKKNKLKIVKVQVNLRSLERKINLRILKNLEFYGKHETIVFDKEIVSENDLPQSFKFNKDFDFNDVQNIGTDEQEDNLIHIEGANYTPDNAPAAETNIEYNRKIFTRKKKKINKSYYKVKDHVDLYKTGSSYLEDHKKGVKSFAFSSIGVSEVRQKSIFGVTTFFNYHSGVKVNIFTVNFQESFYRDYLEDLETKRVSFLNGLVNITAFCDEGVEIIDMDELKNAILKLKDHDAEEILESIVKELDLCLWDLPSTKTMDKCKDFYFPVTRVLGNVSIVVAGNKTKIKEITNICEYFNKYHVAIKGILINPIKNKNNKK